MSYDRPDENNPEYQEVYHRAEARVQAKLGFYTHLAAYLVVNGFLVAMYLVIGISEGHLGYPWVIWPILGWGVAIVFHFMGTFVPFKGVRDRMMREELRKMEIERSKRS